MLQGTFLKVYDKSTVYVCFYSNRNGVHIVHSNEPAMLVLENMAFLLLGDFCSKMLFKKKFFLKHVKKLEGNFVLEKKLEM